MLFLLGITSSCGDKKKPTSEAAKITYTCPMHPQIVQEKPGTCPVCGMDLVVFDRTNKDESLTLDERQIALANITTMIVGDTTAQSSIILNGRVLVNPEQTTAISSRIRGRIEQLYIKETGVKVNKGQPLYRIYSEELAALQQEYLVTAAQKKQFPNDEQFSKIEIAAKQKLKLLGQSDDQIERLVTDNKPNPFTLYYSPSAGIVSEIISSEGAYVEEGGTIMMIQDYSEVWIEADIYPSERGKIRDGMMVNVKLPNATGAIPMKLSFISPEIASGTQMIRVRGTLPNPDNSLVPGMQVEIGLSSVRKNTKSLPVNAVIRTGSSAHIWVETSKGKFVPRMVETGTENESDVEIVKGMEDGDRVVSTGAYLLYSEYTLKKGNLNTNQHQH